MVKEDWQMTFEEWWEHHFCPPKRIAVLLHQHIVESALIHDYLVPDEVLEEYPRLERQYG